MKTITVEVGDGTKATLVATVAIPHMSDLGEGVKEVVEEFVHEGVVSPPVSIKVTTEGPNDQ